MKKENSQEQPVTDMFDKMSDHIYDLNSIETSPTKFNIDKWVRSLMKQCLGFTPDKGYLINVREAEDHLSPNLMMMKDDRCVFVIDVKEPGSVLEINHFQYLECQSRKYITKIKGINWGILTNGYEWRLYDLKNGLEIISFDLRTSNALDLTKSGIKVNCWNFVDLHRASLESGVWKEYRRTTVFLMAVLAKTAESKDVKRFLEKHIAGVDGYAINPEFFIERADQLTRQDLTKVIDGWTKQVQLQVSLYIEAKKQIGRRNAKSYSNTLTQELMLGDVSAPEKSSEFSPY